MAITLPRLCDDGGGNVLRQAKPGYEVPYPPSPPHGVRLSQFLPTFSGAARVNDINQLRDDVARHFFMERQAAGEGIGALSPPSRPPGSPPLTAVTGGGRGASPENSRATSPRSASPRGAVKGPGRSGARDGDGGSRPVSPARSSRSGKLDFM